VCFPVTIRRYFIGGPPNPTTSYTNPTLLPQVIIEYTPCNETEDAICNNQSYSNTLQSFTTPSPLNLYHLDGVTLVSDISSLYKPSSRVIEVCSISRPVLRDPITNIVLTENVDYTIVEVVNQGNVPNADLCCHKCYQGQVCNFSTCELTVIYQDCDDGLLKSTLRGSTSSFSTGCVISGHIVKNVSAGADMACSVVENPVIPSPSAINVYYWYDCGATMPSCSQFNPS